MLARFLGLLVTSFLLLVTLVSPSFAQTATPSASQLSVTHYQPLPATISPTSPIFTDLLLSNVFHSFSCLAVGSSIIGQPCLSYQSLKNAQGAIQTVPVLSQSNLSGGALGTVSSIIATLYLNPPIKTTDYLSSLKGGLGIIKEAHAQVAGSGEAVLSPIFNLWQVSRNIAYLIMIIIFVVIGLMVMFRQRINPQTVITAQTAIPGLVIGLILITFSYFLAALITDTAFIGTNLVGYYFIAAQPDAKQENLVQKTNTDNVITIVSSLIKGVKKDDIATAVGTLFNSLGEPDLTNTSSPATLIRSFAAASAYQLGSSFGPAIGAGVAAVGCGIAALPFGPLTFGAIPVCATIGQIVAGPVIGAGLAVATWNNPGGMVGYAVWVATIVIIVYSMLKLLLNLMKAFLNIIFLTIIAPFQFLAASLPGRQGIATAWILNMLCHVLAFPGVMAVLYFANYMMGALPGSPFQIVNSSNITTQSSLPLLGGLDLSFIRVLLAFAAIVVSPSIPDLICKTIGKIGPAGQIIGQELTGSIGAGRGYLNQGQGTLGNISQDISKTHGLINQEDVQLVERAPGVYDTIPIRRVGLFGKLPRFGKNKGAGGGGVI